jgi:hypothetical protein
MFYAHVMKLPKLPPLPPPPPKVCFHPYNQTPMIEQVCYIKECKEILDLDYGVTKILLSLCS